MDANAFLLCFFLSVSQSQFSNSYLKKSNRLPTPIRLTIKSESYHNLMSAHSRHAPTVERGMPDLEYYQDRQEKGWTEVSPSLMNRIRFQKGKPDLDLTLCSISKLKDLVECIKEVHGEQVTSLNLSYNRIRMLPSNFVSEMCNLQTLELSHNELKTLPDNFGELDQLCYLDISHNKLQKLPLSMGKMSRLHHLSIQDNPFRPPLAEFLEYESGRSSDGNMASAHTAQMVVKFLAQLATETLIIGSGDHPLPVRRRGVTFENDNFEEEEELDQEDVINNNVDSDTYFGGTLRRDELCVDAEMAGGHHLLQMVDYNKVVEPKQKKKVGLLDHIMTRGIQNDTIYPVPLVGKTSSFIRAHQQLKEGSSMWNQTRFAGVLLAIPLLLAVLMIFPALFFETSAMEKYAKQYRFTNSYWDTLKPIYEAAEYCMSCLTHRPFLVEGPRPRPLDNYNHFMAMFVALKNALANMVQALTGVFSRGAGASV